MAKEPRSVTSVNVAVVPPKTPPTRQVTAPPEGDIDNGQDIRRGSDFTRIPLISQIRQQSDIVTQVRMLAQNERFTSFSVFAAVELSKTSLQIHGFKNGTTEFDQGAANMAKVLIASIDTLTDYTKKFQKKPTFEQIKETMLREVALTSAVAAEVVFDKATLLPDRINLVPYETISYKKKKDGVVPVQKPSSGDDITLDIANFFISELHLEANQNYSVPHLKSALIDTFQNSDFIDDVRRVVNRVGHSRMVVTLSADKVLANAPDEVRDDDEKKATYLASTQSEVQRSLAQLSPEDSIVIYDSMTADVKDIGGEKADYVPFMQHMNNTQATSLKTPPSILGIRSEGSQSLSNSETLLYLKIAAAIQRPVADILSRILTMMVRLQGVDGYIKVEFDPVELRPEGERESFKLTRQKRILELLSLGVISDDRACAKLGVPYNPDMPELSGTRFYDKQSNATAVEDISDNSNGMERTLNPDTADKAGGEDQ